MCNVAISNAHPCTHTACNQFGGQEPGSADEIATFCSRTYNVTFPIMEKVEVNGDAAAPLYQWLKSQKKQLMMERIKWNFGMERCAIVMQRVQYRVCSKSEQYVGEWEQHHGFSRFTPVYTTQKNS